MEGDKRFGWNYDILVAGISCSRCACSGASEAAYQGTFAAAREAPDQSAQTGTATDKPSGTFALAFDFALVLAGVYLEPGNRV